MDDDIERLRNAIPLMTDAERQQAQLYIDRIISVRDLFRFAQTLITGILTRTDDSER
jgi:hypothetical protein